MYQDGQTATNPTTGEKVVLQGGQWVPMGGSAPAPRQQAPGIIYGRPKSVDPMEAERLRLAQEANRRAQEDQERQNRNDQRGTIPAGYERKPDGTVGPMAGYDPAKTAKPNEGESKASAFLTRALGANISYERAGVGPRSLVGQTLADTVPGVLNSLPGAVGNSPERQVSDSAQEEFIAASLRQDSGAAIPPEEMARQRRIYFPMPGDGPEVIAQKRAARLRAIAGLKESAGTALADDQAQILKQFDPDIQAALRGEASMPGRALTIKFGDEAAPVTGISLTAAQQAEIEQAMRVGDEGQALALMQRYSGNPPTPGTVESIKAGIEALKRDPKTSVSFDYGAADAAAASADERERFGDNLAPAMEQRKDLVVDPIVRGVADIVPFSDEIAATGNTIFGGGSYADNIRRERAIDEADSRVNAGLRIGGQLGGAAIPIGRILGFGRTAGGVARSATSYGAEAGTMGGLYAAGKADPSPDASMGEALGQRASAIPGGALIGGATGYGLSRLAARWANRSGGNNPPGGGGREIEAGIDDAAPLSAAQRSAMATAANDLNIEVTRGDVGGTMARMARGVLEKTPGGDPISRQAMRTVGQTATARDRIAGTIGAVSDTAGAGQALQRGARDFLEKTAQKTDKLANRIPIPSDRTAQAATTRGALQELTAGLESNPQLSAMFKDPKLEGYLSALTKKEKQVPTGILDQNGKAVTRGVTEGGDLSWSDMKRFRSRIGEIIEQPSVAGESTPRAALRRLYGAITQDMQATASAEGPAALNAFQRFNRYYRGRESRREGILTDILGASFDKGSEAAFERLNSWAQTKGGNFANVARTLRSLPPEEANSVRASLIAQMGQSNPGQQNAAGTLFSPDVYATQWNKLSPRAKAFLFPERQHRDALDKLALVTTGLKRAGTEYRNFSNTTLGTNAVAFLTGMQVAPISTIATAVGTYGAGRMMASPVAAQWAARMALTPPQKLAPLVNSLSVVARRDPAIAQDALGLQQYLQQAMSNVPLRAAAGDEEAQGREVPVQR